MLFAAEFCKQGATFISEEKKKHVFLSILHDKFIFSSKNIPEKKKYDIN